MNFEQLLLLATQENSLQTGALIIFMLISYVGFKVTKAAFEFLWKALKIMIPTFMILVFIFIYYTQII